MPRQKADSREKGQILLIVVLASVIALTVGLSAISRSVTNTRISTEEANSQKALAAAEAGIEEQVNKASQGITSGTGTITLNNNSVFNATSDTLDGTRILINNGLPVARDEGADIWISNYPDFTSPRSNTRLTLYWNNKTRGVTDCNQDPAIEIALIYGDRNTPSMARFALDHCSRGNNFIFPNGATAVNIQGTNYTFDHSYTFPGGNIDRGYIARVIPLYNDSVMAVASTNNGVPLPPQGYIINSTGTAGDTVRKVRVFQGFPRVPVEFFPYNLFVP